MKRKKNLSRILQLAACTLPIVLIATLAAHTGDPSASQPLAAAHSSFAFGELSRAVIPHSSFAAAATDVAAPEPGAGESAAEPLTVNSQPTIDPGPFQPVIDGLVGKYGWLTTVLLAIGSLRILFKPLMLVVENAVQNDPARLAAIQRFEAGPVYKVIATVLDVGASIKLPLVKPPGPPTP